MAKRTIKSKIELVSEQDESQILNVTVLIDCNHAHDTERMLQGFASQIQLTPGYKLKPQKQAKKKSDPPEDVCGVYV